MTQDVDVLSPRAAEVADELRAYLSKRFHIAMRLRQLAEGRGYRLFQVRKPRNRHLVYVRPVTALPPTREVGEVLVVALAELIAMKVTALARRRKQPKAGTDWRDLAALLLAFPELKKRSGPVRESLEAAGASPEIFSTWDEIVAQEIVPASEDEEF